MTVPYRTRDALQRDLDDKRRENHHLVLAILVLTVVSLGFCRYVLSERDDAVEALALCESGGL